jgi:phosphatidylethanolamine-binding protein (PEBP) family uncharacterized protein
VSPTIYTGSDGTTPCEECVKILDTISVPVKSKCPTNLRNWSNCANADVSGVIYIGSNLVYSFTSTFDTNLLIDTLDTNDGDVVDITLIPNVTNSVVTLNVMYNGFSLFSQTSSSDDIRFVFTINCDSKINPYQIDIFSTCNQIEPSIVLYSTSYNENDLISTTYYSSVNCLQTNVSPEMTWVLNGFDTSKVVSYEILCEDLNASGSSPDGYFVHWWVTDINNNQLNIPSSGSWISGNVLPTDYGYGDDDNGWNGPCPSSSPLTHDYRIRISALLDNGNIINSNYSIFQASCISPFC